MNLSPNRCHRPPATTLSSHGTRLHNERQNWPKPYLAENKAGRQNIENLKVEDVVLTLVTLMRMIPSGWRISGLRLVALLA